MSSLLEKEKKKKQKAQATVEEKKV